MAETQKDLTARNVTTGGGGKTDEGGIPAAGSSGQKTGTTEKRKKRERAGKSAPKDGAEQLRWAADRRIGRNSEKLAQMLQEKALGGDLASAKLLMELAAGKKPIPVKKDPARSLALRLAALPQQEPWQEEAKKGFWSGK